MTETVSVQVPVATTPKKAAAKKTGPTKKAVAAKAKAHPPAGEMVNAAIAALKDKKGSSLQAIKKYVETTYKVDLKRQAIFIKKYLKSSVEKKTIVQVKGTGANGRFKLAEKEAGKQVAKKPAAKKPAEKKPVAKKSTTEAAKKTVAKKPTAEKTKKAAKPKALSKSEKAGKTSAALKPKTPKPKKATTPKAKAVKK